LIQDFQQITQLSTHPGTLLLHLGVALLCGILIALVYRYTYKGTNYSWSFVQALVLLNLITAVVILVIGNNLARAFGLVGAMSIIRFRTAVKDTQDIVFIFFALVSGMAAGVGLTYVAFISTLFICLIIILMAATDFGKTTKRQLLLQIIYLVPPESEVEQELSRHLKRFCRNVRLVNLRQYGQEQEMEAHYHITLRNGSGSGELLRTLKAMPQVQSVQLFFDEDEGA